MSSRAPLRNARKGETKLQSKLWIYSGLQKFIVIKKKLFGQFMKCAKSRMKVKQHYY